MDNDQYRTIESSSEGIYKEKGSKFLAFAHPVSNEEEVKEILHQTRKEFHDARHHCYAYQLGVEEKTYRFNDDGEPSGTAGKPIYGQILSFELSNVLIIVVRYFGGTKLGVSGLINAYRGAAKDAIQQARISIKTLLIEYKLSFQYQDINLVMRILKEERAEILKQDFDLDCTMNIKVRKNKKQRFEDRLISSQKIKIINLKNE